MADVFFEDFKECLMSVESKANNMCTFYRFAASDFEMMCGISGKETWFANWYKQAIDAEP